MDLRHRKSSHHCKEVVIALDLCWHLGELLVERIGDVVSWISGDDEDTFSDGGQLDSQTTAAGMRRRQTSRRCETTSTLAAELENCSKVQDCTVCVYFCLLFPK